MCSVVQADLPSTVQPWPGVVTHGTLSHDLTWTRSVTEGTLALQPHPLDVDPHQLELWSKENECVGVELEDGAVVGEPGVVGVALEQWGRGKE